MKTNYARMIWLAVCSAALLHPSSLVLAQPPSLINFQGRLLDGTNLVNGNVGLSLRLFDAASGGTKLYEDSNTVAVVDGLYSTFIGDHPTNAALLVALTNPAVWVETAVNGTTLAPRERLASVGYSLATRGLLVSTNGSTVLNWEAGGNSIDASSEYATIAGGNINRIATNAHLSTIGGGIGNDVKSGSEEATVAGGRGNDIGTNAHWTVIAGGFDNDIADNSESATIAGGRFNKIGLKADHSVISGGSINSIKDQSVFAVIGGGRINVIGTNALYAVIVGGSNNSIAANSRFATILAGESNTIETNSTHSVVVGGSANRIAASNSHVIIAGGGLNEVGANADYAAILGGNDNSVGGNSTHAAIAGGVLNDIGSGSSYTVLGGGIDNNILDDSRYAAIAGGAFNTIGTNSEYAVIPGGRGNEVGPNASYAFAAGRRAKAGHSGVFVWGDDTDADVSSGSSNQVIFRASGGYRIFTSAALTSGVQVTAGSGSWTSLSDVNAKEAFAPVDTCDVLAKVTAMPIATWRYRGQDESIRHMGPTAQDFHAAFGLGDAPGHGITTVDADGVALAAIQALAKENKRLDEENKVLREELDAIKRKLGM